MASRIKVLAMDEQFDVAAAHMPPSDQGWRAAAPRLLAAVWLVLLGRPFQTVLGSDPSALRLWLCSFGLGLFAAVYVWQLWYHPLGSEPTRPRRSITHWAPIVLLTGLSAAMTVGFGPQFIILFVFAGVSTGACLPKDRALAVLAAVMAIATLCGAVAGSSWSNIAGTDLTIFGIGTLIVLLAHLIDTVRDLRAARMEIARLAVSEERLRFSRDLHDLLGHSLSLITLKSELAGRLMESSPAKASAEIHDIERIARSALQETREAVVAYRQPTLASELRAAREMLAAAGISFVSNGAEIEVPSDVESVLAWTVREGVTNVIRHSRATQCVIRVNSTGCEASVEVIDNGFGSIPSSQRAGSGLRGLTERVAAWDGRLDGAPGADGGFRLAVAIPLAFPTPMERQPSMPQFARPI